MEEQEFKRLLLEKTAATEEVIRKFLPEEEGYQKTVIEAMNYSVLVGGKRLRPLFMQECFSMFGGEGNLVEPFMAAMEMIHTYSLVHDDLPAMDNDEFRRGKKTTWAVYGDAFGILAGDGLLNFAFETVLNRLEELPAPEMKKGVKALQILAKKAGIYGMIGGQTADIEGEVLSDLTMEQLLFIHEYKTAALIQAAMLVGAVLAGADEENLARLERCGYCIGVAFQIKDDILDVIGDSKELGKQVGSDMQNHKKTYVSLRGLEKSQEDVESLSKEALKLLDEMPGEKSFLMALVLSLVDRRK